MRLLFTALACLISVSVVGQDINSWIHITFYAEGSNNPYAAYYYIYSIDNINSPILSGTINTNTNEFELETSHVHKLTSGEYYVYFESSTGEEVPISFQIKNDCQENFIVNQTGVIPSDPVIGGGLNTIYFTVNECDELTYVPDNNLESLIESWEDADNGQSNDNYVRRLGLINPGFGNLQISNDNDFGPILDLTGLEDLVLTNGYTNISNTFATEIDLSEIMVFNNGTIHIASHQYLEEIILPSTGFLHSISISSNPNLEKVEMNGNLMFRVVNIGTTNSQFPCFVKISGSIPNPLWSYSNGDYNLILIAAENIDLSSVLSAPYQTRLSLCSTSQINLNNGISIYNWCDPWGDVSIGCWPYLSTDPGLCVELNNQSAVDFCVNNDGWPNDPGINYSTNCYNLNFDCSNFNSVNSLNISKEKNLEKIIDALGREVNHTTNQILFHIYDDGSVEKKFIVE